MKSEEDISQDDFSMLDPEAFPDISANERKKAQNGKSAKTRTPYKNVIRENDSMTICPGFINQVRKVDENYFIKAGLIIGSVMSSDGWRGDITNVELRLGHTLKKWAEAFGQIGNKASGVRVTFKIRNLKFSAKLKDDKPMLESRGIIETITFGHLDGVC